jgi:hypothetical protein
LHFIVRTRRLPLRIDFTDPRVYRAVLVHDPRPLLTDLDPIFVTSGVRVGAVFIDGHTLVDRLYLHAQLRILPAVFVDAPHPVRTGFDAVIVTPRFPVSAVFIDRHTFEPGFQLGTDLGSRGTIFPSGPGARFANRHLTVEAPHVLLDAVSRLLGRIDTAADGAAHHENGEKNDQTDSVQSH